MIVVVGAVIAKWLDKGAAWGVDRSTVLVVGGALAAGRLLVGFSMMARKIEKSPF